MFYNFQNKYYNTQNSLIEEFKKAINSAEAGDHIYMGVDVLEFQEKQLESSIGEDLGCSESPLEKLVRADEEEIDLNKIVKDKGPKVVGFINLDEVEDKGKKWVST